ncbi:MAG: hypothetical protein ABI268_07255, partial [Rhodanobacter sp.]
MLGALLVHLIFLVGFVLGPAFEPTLPPPLRQEVLQIRLIELPPPPPPVHGTPPKERGPRHQGRRSPPVTVTERSANVEAVVAPTPPLKAAQPKPIPPVIVAAVKTAAVKPEPVPVKPKSKPTTMPVNLKRVAPSPAPRPKPLAAEPPAPAIPTPKPLPPVPPQLQPEPVRAPQVEGNRPLLPPMSLTIPTLSQAASPVDLPSMPMHVDVPKLAVAPINVMPFTTQPTAAPQVPKMQPLPLPMQPSPQVNLQPATIAPVVATAQVSMPMEMPAKMELPVRMPAQPAAIALAPTRLEVAPPSTVAAPAV